MLRLRLQALALPVFALILLVACGGGVNDQSVSEAQAQIDAFKSKGMPDAQLSMAKVHLYQVVDFLSKKNATMAKRHMDSVNVHLASAEKFYQEQVANLGPTIDAGREAALKAKEGLTGFQARKIDSVLTVVDSLKKKDWLLQANVSIQTLTALLPTLKQDEEAASRTRRAVPGEWVFEEREKSVEHKEVNAVTRKVFRFMSDGKVELVESKKGQSGPFLREDWEFRSWGTYDLKGDTVMLMINRFAAVRQMFHRIHMVDGNRVWKDEPGPTYDSLITDGSQDRHITFQDLKDDFRQIRRL